MINKIKIRSFKSLENVEVELGRMNVFIGPNGSGKTNLLEAIGVLGAASSGKIDDESLLRRGVRPGIPRLYKSSFKGSQQGNEIRFTAESENACYYIGIYNPFEKPTLSWRFHTEKLTYVVNDKVVEVFDRSHHNIEYANFDEESGLAALEVIKLPQDNPAKELLDSLRNYAIFHPNTDVLRSIVIEQQPRDPVGLSGGGLPEAIYDLLIGIREKNINKNVIDNIFDMIEWADKFDYSPKKSSLLSKSVASSRSVLTFRDKFMEDERNVLTGYDASEGALYVLFCLVMAVHNKSPKFYAIDNFDHALNPRLVKHLIKNYCDWTANSQQVLLTSHNPLVLDGLPIQNDNVRLFAVDRTNRGKTTINRIVLDENIEKLMKEGFTLSRLWVRGDLGGVPDV